MPGLRQIAYPQTPTEVRACLRAAGLGPVAVERHGRPMIVIMPIEEYERLTALGEIAEGPDASAWRAGSPVHQGGRR